MSGAGKWIRYTYRVAALHAVRHVLRIVRVEADYIGNTRERSSLYLDLRRVKNAVRRQTACHAAVAAHGGELRSGETVLRDIAVRKPI